MNQTIVFKEWLPDQPTLGNGGLTVANNVIPVNGFYRNFEPLIDFNASTLLMPVAPIGAIYAETESQSRFYVGASTDLYVSDTSDAFVKRSSATYNAVSYWQFAQFNELIIATSKENAPQRHTIGSVSNFLALAATGTAPRAAAIGVIGDFVMLGNLSDSGGTSRPYTVAWPAIDDSTNWPAPNSATAIAMQSGEQVMNAKYGNVTSITGGDQFGIILQEGGITRASYVGPPVVFQFDTISENFGAIFPNATIKVGGLTYFISSSGFCATDGVSVLPIGAGKVDEYFWSIVDSNLNYVRVASNPILKIIQWAVTTNGSTPTKLIIYNFETKQWSSADQNVRAMFGPQLSVQSLALTNIYGFSTSNRVGWFNGVPGTATLTTGDVEIEPGGRGFIDGIKPNIESSGTAPSVSVRIGYRDDLATTPSYTSTTGATAATGFADFRVDSKYARAEITVTGNFDKITGAVISATPSSGR